jgi:hypothetical protein
MRRWTASYDLAAVIVLAIFAAGWITATRMAHPAGLSFDGVLDVLIDQRARDGDAMRALPLPNAGASPDPTPACVGRQAGAFGLLVLACAVVLVYGLVRARRTRGRASAGFTRLALRAGVLALILGLAGAAVCEATDLLVLETLRLRPWAIFTGWTDADRASTPWGSLVLTWSGATMAMLGIVASVWHLARRPHRWGTRP